MYGVIRHKGRLGFGAIGIGEEPAEVELVRDRDLAAVVSGTRLSVLDPTRENVLAHERVNQRVMQNHTLVPMSFGTIFRSREDVAELLRSAHATLRRALNLLAGKVELGLEVLWNPEEERRLHHFLSHSREAVAAASGDFAARLEYGRLLEAWRQERAAEISAEVLAGLRDVSVASRVNAPKVPRMILNAAFLVARDRRAAFTRRLRAIDARYRTLTFRLTGPWPPYHFVSIRLKLAGESAP